MATAQAVRASAFAELGLAALGAPLHATAGGARGRESAAKATMLAAGLPPEGCRGAGDAALATLTAPALKPLAAAAAVGAPRCEGGGGRFMPFRPCWQKGRSADPRPVHCNLVEIPALDRAIKTKLGQVRVSDGVIRYSAVHGVHFRSDADELLRILWHMKPHGSVVWSLPKLEKAYRMKIGRSGSWVRYELSLRSFLSLFPRSFELYGSEDAFVRASRSTRTAVAEGDEEVMKRLAVARHTGFIDQETQVEGSSRNMSKAAPDVQHCRARATYLPSSEPASRRPSRPASSVPSQRPSRPASAPAYRSSRPTSALYA